MMNKAKIFLLVLGIAAIGGCASHGKSIMTAFQQDEVSPPLLQEKMKWLEPVIAEGKTHEQFRVVKTLRYNAKYHPDLEKRKLAVQGLIFVTVFATDSDVRSSAQSRLTTILNNSYEDFDLRLAVLDAKKDLVLGRFFYEEKEPSLFSNKMEIEPAFPDESDRQDALEYLIEHFEVLEVDLQQHLVSAFRQILGNQPVCLETDDRGCEETDGEAQEEWKQALGNQINYWAANDCDWDRNTISEEVKNALRALGNDYPDRITGTSPRCASHHPVSEDYSVLEMRSIKIPNNYWQFGVDLTDASSNGLHASNIEFGFGNGKTFGVIFGMNIDEKWMEPLREKYITIEYRGKNSNTMIGMTRTIRTPDFSLVGAKAEDADGTIDGESQHVYGTDENDVFIASAVEFEGISSHLHLYIGAINQKIGWQTFIRSPDISLIVEGNSRSEMKVKPRETDTLLNEDRIERRSQANNLRNDILVGAKWNHVSLFRNLFVGRGNRDGREGIFNFRLYHSVKREKTYLVVTSPF